MSDIKLIFADASSQLNPQVFEKLIPEGILLDIKEYSTENKVYQSSMKMSIGKLNGYLPIKLSGDFKVTYQWPGYWNNYFKVMLDNINANLADRKLPAELISVLKSEDISAKIMPQLQSFGKILFSVDFDIPASLSFTEGKGSFELKSDLYDLGAVGTLNQEGGSIKLKTRNASPLMADLEAYVTRASQPFSQSYPLEVQNLKGFLKGGRTVLDKILEPSAAVEQSLHIQVNKEGLKIGNYDVVQILGMFGEAMSKE